MEVSGFAIEDCLHANEKVEQWIQDIGFEDISLESVAERQPERASWEPSAPAFDMLSKLFADRTNTVNHYPSNEITGDKKRKRGESTEENLVAGKLAGAIQQSLIDLKDESIKSICKHGVEGLKDSKLAIFPRSFQHHTINRWLRDQYSFQNSKVFKNKNCAQSPCGTVVPGNKSRSWIDYKYIKISLIDEANNEILCRFCYGKNWVKCTNFFRHLFLSHGILTKLEASRDGNDPNIPLDMPKVFKNWQNIAFEFIPVPKLYFCMKFSTGFRRTHVQCPNCNKWIRLSWCEYDEILLEEDTHSATVTNSNDFDVTYSTKRVYVQNRDRSLVDGFYENYFSHYVRCDREKYGHGDPFIKMK